MFAVIAALLAGVGLYGVLSTVVRQRTSEIGVRMTLGAGRGNIFKLVVGQGLRLTAIGIFAGLIAALILTRGMATMLVGVKATNRNFRYHGDSVLAARRLGVLASRMAGRKSQSYGRSSQRVEILAKRKR